MAGTKGRSGGSNRRSRRDHILSGTFRGDRHAWLPAPGDPAVADVCEPPAHLGAEAKAAWTELATRYRAATTPIERIELAAVHLAAFRSAYAATERIAERQAAGVTIDASRLHRGLRQTAELLRSLLGGLELIDHTTEATEFDEFDRDFGPLAQFIRRGERMRRGSSQERKQ